MWIIDVPRGTIFLDVLPEEMVLKYQASCDETHWRSIAHRELLKVGTPGRVR